LGRGPGAARRLLAGALVALLAVAGGVAPRPADRRPAPRHRPGFRRRRAALGGRHRLAGGAARLRQAGQAAAGGGAPPPAGRAAPADGRGSLLARLCELPAPPWLRTLGFCWPPDVLRRDGVPERRPAVGGDFVAALLASPLGGRLTHLASSPA